MKKCNPLAPLLFSIFIGVAIFTLALINWNDKGTVRTLAVVVLILSVMMTGLGGLMDIADEKRIGYLSKKHAWNDGLYLAVVAVALFMMSK